MIIDIREDKGEVEGIKFDDSGDIITWDEVTLNLAKGAETTILSSWEDLDNFIKACHKAKELWGNE